MSRYDREAEALAYHLDRHFAPDRHFELRCIRHGDFERPSSREPPPRLVHLPARAAFVCPECEFVYSDRVAEEVATWDMDERRFTPSGRAIRRGYATAA